MTGKATSTSGPANNSGHSGIGPRNPPGRNLVAAVITGVLLGALVLIALFFGELTWYITVAAAVVIATCEVARRLHDAGYHLPLLTMLAGGQLMVWLSKGFGLRGLIIGFLASILTVMFIRLFGATHKDTPPEYLRDVCMSMFVLVWIPFFASFAAMIYTIDTGDGNENSGIYLVIVLFACVVASDVGGYAFGVFFGRHPMAPSVSPKKSWEGFIGSLLCAGICGLLLVTFLLGESWYLGFPMGVFLAICATLGDLVESQFKRAIGVKDMSNLLPGHGGIMDRLDGLLPAATVTWLFLSFIVTP